ncbi:hypothetical protein [uncultured Sulfitobacter sp.]|uniref:hypothetical protein n=1 Tax=uncultured Sulfitobacter sp. TaxID=191468 RepID=UPI0026104EC5|nr:hypothetical protein [uncultured Sulfitobacter sp.]
MDRFQYRFRVEQQVPRPNRFYEIDQPPSRRDFATRLSCGGNYGQALASCVHRGSVYDVHMISMAILRAVATAALRNPRHPAGRTAQDFNVEKRFTGLITQDPS